MEYWNNGKYNLNELLMSQVFYFDDVPLIQFGTLLKGYFICVCNNLQ